MHAGDKLDQLYVQLSLQIYVIETNYVFCKNKESMW